MTASFLCLRVVHHLLAHWMLGLHWCVVICHVFSSPGIKTRSFAANRSRKVAVTLPEFSLCFSKHEL